ncbi:MAG: hypothetical protein AAGC96_10325 [Pseudomonadota bacterium]
MFKLFGRKSEPQSERDDTGVMALVMQRAQIGQIYAERLCDGGENQSVERRYYENVRDELLDLLAQMGDRHCREMATQSVIKMCMAAGDEAVARALFVGVEDRFLRQKILAAVPSLGSIDRADSLLPADHHKPTLVLKSPNPKDGSVEVWPDGQDHGFSIRPDGDRFALYNRHGKWFECDSIEEGRRLLENLLKDGRSG